MTHAFYISNKTDQITLESSGKDKVWNFIIILNKAWEIIEEHSKHEVCLSAPAHSYRVCESIKDVRTIYIRPVRIALAH